MILVVLNVLADAIGLHRFQITTR